MKCPRCHTAVEGRFCGFCGSALQSRQCHACSSPVPPGFRFCSDCGAEQGRPTDPGSAEDEGKVVAAGRETGASPSGAPAASPSDEANRKAWWIAGAAVVGGILFLSVPYVWTGWADQGDGERIPMGANASAPAPGPAPNVDLSTMTPREAADRLFNRVMTALGEGDQGEVENFLPMAIDAYRLVPDLDADGHFHLSLLEQAAGDHQAALQTAEEVLESEPDHLLALYAAGQAAHELGETDRAAAHFRHVLDVYETESARDLPEYREHASFLPTVRQTAQDFLAQYES